MKITDPAVETAIRDSCASLSALSFIHPLTDSETKIAQNAMQRKTPNVGRLGTRWVIRYYFGGRQRCFGFYDQYVDAMRVADLLIYQFNGLRTRFKKILTDDDFNITLNRAKTDYENEHEFVQHLIHIRNLLPEKTARPSRKGVRLKTQSEAIRGLEGKIVLLTQQIMQQSAELNALSIAVRNLSVGTGTVVPYVSPLVPTITPYAEPYTITCEAAKLSENKGSEIFS